MFTAIVAYTFLWIGATALVLLGSQRLERRPSLGLALGVGWGVGVVLSALLELLGGFDRMPVAFLSSAVLGPAIVVSLRRRAWPTLTWWDLTLGGLVGLMALGPLAEAGTGYVYGDASHNWFLKARMLVTDGTPATYFAQGRPLTHPGYPPLHPLSLAWMQHVRGGVWSDAAANLSGVFTASAIAWLIGAAVAPVAGRLAGLLAASTFVALPYVQRTAPMGNADILLAYFAIAAVLALVAADGARADRFWIPLAALMTAGASVTKAEGVVIAAALTVGAVVTRSGPVRRRIGGAAGVAAAGLAAALAWTLVRRQVYPELSFEAGDIGAAPVVALLSEPGQFERWGVGLHLVWGTLTSGMWQGPFWTVLALALVWPRSWCRTARALVVVLAVVLCSLILALAASRDTVDGATGEPLPRNLLLVYPIAVTLIALRLGTRHQPSPPLPLTARPWQTGLAIVAASVLLAATPHAPWDTPRITGGDLESDTSWTRPTPAIRYSAAGARTGRAGLTLSARVTRGVMAVNRTIVAHPGETLLLQYWARGSRDSTSRVYVEWNSATTGTVNGPGAGSAGSDFWYWGGGQWERRVISWTMPPGSTQAYVVAQAMRGEVSFDDFTVVAGNAERSRLNDWWLVVAVALGLGLANRAPTINVAMVAFGAWASLMAWQTASVQVPKIWGAFSSDVTGGPDEPSSRWIWSALGQHADGVRPWLDPSLPLAVRTGRADFRHATSLEYLLYGDYAPGTAHADGRCNVLTFTRHLVTGAALPEEELALMPPRNAVHRAAVQSGDVYVAQGDCQSGPVVVTPPAPPRR